MCIRDRLNTAFETAGFNAEKAQEAYNGFFEILGDTGQATEASQLLAQLATSSEDISKWAVSYTHLELLCGLSPGILTPPTTSYATATEMRAALNSTFAVITKFRRALERGTDDLLHAVDVLSLIHIC